MFRSTRPRSVGYTPVNPDTSPMVAYSQYHWHYNLPQGMERPHSVNRTFAAPFQSNHSLVNKYRGVWIEFDMHPAFSVALEPQLRKLPRGRTLPKTPAEEVIADYTALAPLVDDEKTRDLWLAKVFQHCAFQRCGGAMELWERYCHQRFTAEGATAKPPLSLVKSVLFYCNKTDNSGWRALFDRCLKDGWNYTPLFDTAQWSFMLKSIGRMGDEDGVRAVLEEMLDVQADLDRVEARSVVIALNAVTNADVYEFVKKYLFNFGERKVKFLRTTYSDLRGHGAGKLRIPLKENDNMYYHVCWHSSIRSPRQFSPRQLYFDYTPSTLGSSSHNPNAKIDDIVKDKIEKWKAEGLLPEDYVHEDRVYDRSAAFKNVARQEKWKKMPKILKSKRMGYTGDP
ncbi:uncharacterized protein TEOVI_000427100 [Trypanosoma equiperdum]|uniref:Uncharacterized protein n=3 Tax=Trypanozoon TaxID=39700 RepID=Q584U8_TRYB2|nr:hypothetical protein, conserved [Trypanosoma brucei gambiense DAL972]XP_845329.1 hypothetical protein, conserved [Trypanosoma brucei brucei TREU927]6HIV_DJ Chain DJ, ms57 [Trypanosoma brucei brucei]6HIW_DJ Chain DJ, mS57 [Trypanosoma brucei brucei]6HIZ_DJ Chain DJ, mS57 [Trypanosoma brucei brucei]6SG9_DJ Chain DJ, mS57 [Trypanosoma brucei brucei]6SGB_DJ Chain DJ, mS57 [Trypanosoma brucei brucei]7PUA_DJ Chain DJ, mS57 [Trypanosoma brucei brucei]7PUB_DJ Chain DJ, mS57 [Trypanosoma brucei b|eukprot:XP_011773989.1 hypothetical protein, conserved [Trypanosoma brucei gambiense DAL972]